MEAKHVRRATTKKEHSVLKKAAKITRAIDQIDETIGRHAPSQQSHYEMLLKRKGM